MITQQDLVKSNLKLYINNINITATSGNIFTEDFNQTIGGTYENPG